MTLEGRFVLEDRTDTCLVSYSSDLVTVANQKTMASMLLSLKSNL